MKQVRFPQIAYRFTDMSAFPTEPDPGGAYATAEEAQETLMPDEKLVSDVLAVGLIDMQVRIYHQGRYVDVADHGIATGGSATTLSDTTKAWTATGVNPGEHDENSVRILGGPVAPMDSVRVASTTTPPPTVNTAVNFTYAPGARASYRIENKDDPLTPQPKDAKNAQPTWVALPVAPWTEAEALPRESLPMRVIESNEHTLNGETAGTQLGDVIHMPYLVEVTMTFVDQQGRNRRTHTFTQRYALPTTNWREQGT
jgi:hypothetical protein